MPPLPKKKTSKSRKGRRASHLHLSLPPLSLCPHCHTPKRPHHVCQKCGYYHGREVVLFTAEKG